MAATEVVKSIIDANHSLQHAMRDGAAAAGDLVILDKYGKAGRSTDNAEVISEQTMSLPRR